MDHFNEQEQESFKNKEEGFRNHFITAEKHSGPGIASFVMSLLAGIGYIVLFVGGVAVLSTQLAGLMPNLNLENLEQLQQTPELVASLLFIGLGMLGSFVFALIGLILGIIGLLQQNRKKVFAVIGTVLSGLLVGIPLLFFLFSMGMGV